MYDWSVTQTGQPGPLISLSLAGSKLRRPFRAIAIVCVPHISITLTLFRELGNRSHKL